LCQKCHKNLATIRYAEVVDGQVTEQQLCAECMASHEQEAAAGFELAGPAPSVNRPAVARAVRDVVRRQRKCSHCGTPLASIVERLRAGCSDCYTSFPEAIETALRSVHGGVVHKGKVAHQNDARTRLRTELQNKRILLRSVLRAENYEEAARLRDEIRRLEQGVQLSETATD
jgi:protein arginine kinase activator